MSFTYIVGFNDTAISSRTLDDANQDVKIMDDLRETIYKVLAFGDITRRRLSRQLVGFKTDDPYAAIRHKNLIDEEECPESFEVAASCVRVVTEILLQANPDTYDQESVSKAVNDPIKESMAQDLFIDTSQREEVQEVKYLGPGSVLTVDPIVPTVSRGSILNGSGIAAISVASVVLLFGIVLFAFSRSRVEDDRSNGPDSSEVSEDEVTSSAALDDDKANLPVIDETGLFEATSLSKVAQLDLESGGVIPPIVSDGSNAESSSSSKYGSSDDESEIMIGRLDAAVSAGDWAAVAAIAGDLSSADEASSYSSVHTPKLDTSRSDLSGEDAARAAKIDKLIAEGDWNAVGATAAAFDSDASSSDSGDIGSGDHGTNGDGKKKSILDFIAGPWQSSAAAKAIVEDTADNVEDMNVDGSKCSRIFYPMFLRSQ